MCIRDSALDRMGIPYDVTPGVSSFLAAAASLKKEYTLPGVSQTVILTRKGGRTEVPEKEDLKALAEHQATMIIFLSVGQIEEVAADLAPSYGWDAPAAVVYKACLLYTSSGFRFSSCTPSPPSAAGTRGSPPGLPPV